MEKPSILLVGGECMLSYAQSLITDKQIKFRYASDFNYRTYSKRFKPSPVGIVIDVDEYGYWALQKGLRSVFEVVTELKTEIRKSWPQAVFFFLNGHHQIPEAGVILFDHPKDISAKELRAAIDESLTVK